MSKIGQNKVAKKLLALIFLLTFTLLMVACSDTNNINAVEKANNVEVADSITEVELDANETDVENKDSETEEVVYQGVTFQIPVNWELKSNTSSQLSYYFDSKNVFMYSSYTELGLNNMENNFLNPEYESAFLNGFEENGTLSNIAASLIKINGYQSYKVSYEMQSDGVPISAITYAFPVNTGMCSLNFGKTNASNIDLESYTDKFVEGITFDVASEKNSSISDIDSKLATLEKEASEMASNSTKIESGELYDSIKSIHDDVSITQMDETSLLLVIKVPYTSPDESVKQLFDLVSDICNTCNLENKYDSVVFSMQDSNGFNSNMVFTSYKEPSDFSSTEPVLFNSDEFQDYKDILSNTYLERYSNTDVMSSFENDLDSLRKNRK